MDRKITELDSIEKLAGNEYFVVASESDNENYKIRIEDFLSDDVVSGSGFGITVDGALSLTSKNPVQNKIITAELINLDKRIDTLDGGGGGVFGDFDLAIANVETETLAATQNANVIITDLGTDSSNTKSLAFKFSIPRGASGEKGETGASGVGGRTVFVFKSSETRPDKPVGGSWDPDTNIIIYPQGWSPTDNLVPPIWMSNATFNDHKIVIDWSTPIRITGEDGVAGTDGTNIEFIYRLFKDEQFGLTPPASDPYRPDIVPEYWNDHPSGVTEEMRCEYVCTRSKDVETGLWGAWSTPALWSKYGVNGKDGDSIEYIYQLTTSEAIRPATPTKTPSSLSPVQDYQEREFIPISAEGELPWTDNPSSVSKTYPCEWVSVRKFSFSTQKWGDFSEPTLWAKYGVDGDPGEPGTGINILGSFDSEEALIAAWQSGTLPKEPEETGDAYVVDGNIYVFDGDEFLNCGYIKGEPGQSTYLHIKYSDDGYSFTSNNGETIGKYIGIRVDYVEQDSSIFSDYTWSRFRGNDGFGYEYIFQLSTENIAPTVPTQITATGVAPTGWTEDPTGVDSTNKYEWCCYRKSDEDGNWGPWTGRSGGSYAWLFAMWAESLPGETGKPGPILYPAGVWGEDIESASQKGSYVNGEWVATATPYVLHNGTFYVLDVQSSSQEPGTGNDWLAMEMFNAIYTDILLANNAKVGQAIFNGDYMFSQKGVNPQTGEAGDYYNFNTTGTPYTESSTFDPNWCVNLKTGEMWNLAGNVKFDTDRLKLGNWYINKYGQLRSEYDSSNNYVTLDPSSGLFINKLVSPGAQESSHKMALNIDGSGYLANQNISWNSDGTELIIGGGDSWHSNTINLTENGLIIKPTNSPTTESTDLQITHNEIIIGRYFGGLKLDSNGVYTRTSPTEEWTPINKKSSGVQFVSSLPSNPDDDTLYVIV